MMANEIESETESEMVWYTPASDRGVLYELERTLIDEVENVVVAHVAIEFHHGCGDIGWAAADRAIEVACEACLRALDTSPETRARHRELRLADGE